MTLRDFALRARAVVGLNGRWTPGAPPFGEWLGARPLALWAWVPLGFLVAVPFPLHGWLLPERAVPIMWLLLGGAIMLMSIVARASWPLAALLAWAVARAGFMQFPLRALQVLLLFALGGLLYAAARELSPRARRWVSWAFLLGIAWEFAFGLVNLFGQYPGMLWVDPRYMGKPMGFLTHVNYFGSLLALGLPLSWALLGLPAALVMFTMICLTVSGGPVISASAGALFLAWPELGRRSRMGVAGFLGGAVALVMTLHEWRLSGRWEVWAAVLPEYLRYPVIGQGLGSWRVWADHTNYKLEIQRGQPPGTVVFATLQAHNEVIQLAFELGLIGLVLGGLWAWQAWRAGSAVMRATAPALDRPWWGPGRIPLERAWVGILVVAAVNMLGSPTFHLPAQGALVLFALGAVQAAGVPVGPLDASRAYAPDIGTRSPKRHRATHPARPSARAERS